ncbi:MAG: chromosome segregation protein SMC [Parvularculaceae bacterium]
MKFERLRLCGFKSFVEPTDFQIAPGITGVIGPNGCGKSNLVEALQWAMGATSAKSLRSGGMEDVIFSGAAGRPARNWAEVTIAIDNRDRTAPAIFNDSDELEVVRRIERDMGSSYRVNGKEVRAKDVQLLFADAAAGANASAIVRQGRIAEIINAKPQQRRKLLEEAAGVSGLNTRRHEAELRLRASETNMERLDDLLSELHGQRAGLARQARQATRYRNLSGHIRRAEAMVVYSRWKAAHDAKREADERLRVLKHDAEEASREAARAAAASAEATEKLPPLRQSEAEAAAALQRLNSERDLLTRDQERAQEKIRELTRRVAESDNDLARETENARDAETAISAIKRDAGELERAAVEGEQALENDEAALRAEIQKLSDEEETLSSLRMRMEKLAAEREKLANAAREARSLAERCEAQAAEARREKAALSEETDLLDALSAAQDALTDAKSAVEEAEAALSEAESARAETAAAESESLAPLRELEDALTELTAERAAIAKFLDASVHGGDAQAVEQIRVAQGYETALAAALGDDLAASLDENAPARWRRDQAETPLSPLPEGVRPLIEFVDAPAALSRRLKMIGVVGRGDGDALQSRLAPGQRLVSIEGDLWRWDGLAARADAKTPAAIRLEQKNRLDALELEIAGLKVEVETARNAHAAAAAAARDAMREETARREIARARQRALQEAQAALSSCEREASRATARLAALEQTMLRLDEEIRDALARAEEAESALAQLAPVEPLKDRLKEQEAAVACRREALADAKAALAAKRQESEDRKRRLKDILRQMDEWSVRASRAAERIKTLNSRKEDIAVALAEAEKAPAWFEEALAKLADGLSVAEARRNRAADALAAAETAAREAESHARASEKRLAEKREALIRAEADCENSAARLLETIDLARERCNAEPGQLLTIAEHKSGDPLPGREAAEAKLEKLKREREKLGGVNLRAEEEMTELDARINEIESERNDLEEAIAKLRDAISKLNREGRERLRAAFDTVNGNFKTLFRQLFDGGQAELRLVDSDDPLDAGLEVVASPPGKKLASLSLLSGGEQALTATALIFAAFLSNPAPVCVLDEVDAPLDDANVDRFCNVVREIASQAQTRFLIVTHHPLTMARMDRLYGVTMAERGVSQLVSVDLSEAERLVAAE